MGLKQAFLQAKRRRTFAALRRGKQDPNTLPPYERGLYYEDWVCRHLRAQGYHILDRNYRARKQSEIDLVAKDGKTLVFVEVKARRRITVYSPLRAVDETKRRALALAARDYCNALADTGVEMEEIPRRYDVVALYFDGNGRPCALDHYPGYLEEAHEGF